MSRTPSQAWLGQPALLVKVLVGTGGAVLVGTGTFLAGQAVLPALLLAVGGGLLSAGLVAVMLDWLRERETRALLGSVLFAALLDALTPLRDLVDDRAVHQYRWVCLLTTPKSGDADPDYAVQAIRISYRIASLPTTLRFICAATRDDRCLEELGKDEYEFRWVVDDTLKITDPSVFKVEKVRVDHTELRNPTVTTEPVTGGTAQLVSYEVPQSLRDREGQHVVELEVHVRKFFGDDRRIRVQTNTFRTTNDAEFLLSVDPALGVERIQATPEVSRLGVKQAATFEPLFAEPLAHHGAIVRLPFPIQTGSVVAFTLDRSPGHDHLTGDVDPEPIHGKDGVAGRQAP